VEKAKLPGLVEIIKNSFLIYFKRQNFLYFLKIVLLNFGVTLALMLPIMLLVGLFSGDGMIEKIGPATTIFIPTIVLALGAAVWGLLMQATIVVSVTRVVSGEGLGVKETIIIAWGKLGRYFMTNLISGLIIAVGFIFLIIPGIVFGVWYIFAQYLVITQNLRPIQALKASKKLVSGHFWPVLGRLAGIILFSIVLQVALGSVKLFGVIATLLLSPFYVLVPFLLFEDLKKLNAKTSAA